MRRLVIEGDVLRNQQMIDMWGVSVMPWQLLINQRWDLLTGIDRTSRSVHIGITFQPYKAVSEPDSFQTGHIWVSLSRITAHRAVDNPSSVPLVCSCHLHPVVSTAPPLPTHLSLSPIPIYTSFLSASNPLAVLVQCFSQIWFRSDSWQLQSANSGDQDGDDDEFIGDACLNGWCWFFEFLSWPIGQCFFLDFATFLHGYAIESHFCSFNGSCPLYLCCTVDGVIGIPI